MENKNRVNKRGYIAILAIIFTLVIIFRVYNDVKHHDHMLHEDIASLIQNITIVKESSFTKLQEQYETVATTYLNNPLIIKALKDRDRVALELLLEKDYKKFKQYNKDLFVMHWIDTQNTTILRMHKPQSYDDNLTKVRPIVAHVNDTKQTHRGFESGKNGTTYRITIPLIEPEFKEHLGVLEFGIKPDYFIKEIQKHFALKAQILVQTYTLKYLSYKPDFQQLGDYSILSTDPFFDEIMQQTDIADNMRSHSLIEHNNRTYLLIHNLILPDFKNDVHAKIVVAKDISDFIYKYEKSLRYINLINFFILLGSLGLITFVFTRYESAVTRSYARLQRTIDSLLLSRQRHRLAQQIASIGNWEVSHDTQELYWSGEVYNIFDVDSKSFKPSHETFFSCLHPDDVEMVKKEYEESIEEKRSYSIVHRILTSQNNVKYVAEKGEHIFDENGKIFKTLGTVQDITEMHHLKDQANTDSLTGLFNRRSIEKTLKKKIKKSQYQDTPLTIAICDVDHFKRVNDTYGHDNGDIVLKALANTMMDFFRKGDVIGRWGGEEFVIILPNTNLENGVQRLEILREKIEETPITLNDETNIHLTISAGVTSVAEHRIEANPEQLIKDADKALYDAKNTGRNQVIAYKR